MATAIIDLFKSSAKFIMLIAYDHLTATWKLGHFTHPLLASVDSICFGFWRFKRSLDPWVDHILAMDGSPMQKNIVNKHQDDPLLMQRLYRRFYSEKLYDDTTSDEPIVRLRYRNHFGDYVAHSQQNLHVIPRIDSDGKMAHIRRSKVSLNTDADEIGDSIFGCSGTVKDIDQPVGTAPTAREHNRRHRRSNRRRRRMHHERISEAKV